MLHIKIIKNGSSWSCFKVDGNGNCLFLAIKRSLQVHHSGVGGDKDKGQKLPYYPNRYFRCQVINWMVDNRQKVFKYMGSALRASYGVPNPTASHRGPLSYKTYLTKMLKRQFWGDEIILWSVLMWNLKIMVVNSKTLQEYRFYHVIMWPSGMWMWGWYTTPAPIIWLQVSQVSSLLL